MYCHAAMIVESTWQLIDHGQYAVTDRQGERDKAENSVNFEKHFSFVLHEQAAEKCDAHHDQTDNAKYFNHFTHCHSP
jgi:hypothetical protein